MKHFNTIVLGVLVITAMLAGACAPATPERIVETVVVEKEVEKVVKVVETVEVEVEKEVEVVVTATPVPEEGPAFDPDVLYIAHTQDPATVDPHRATSWTEAMLNRNHYERLLKLDKDTGQLTGELAESWDVSDDGTTYTFHLREGIKFHDGSNFNAEAVRFNFDRMVALEAWPAEVWQAIDTIEVVDDRTVQIILKEATGPWINFLVMNPKMVSPSCVREHEVDGDWAQQWLADNICGTGPYMLKSWERGRDLVTVAFDDYWGGWEGKHVTEVHYLNVPEPSVQRLMLEAGDLDVAIKYEPQFIEAYRDNPDIQLLEEDTPTQVYIRLNPNCGPTQDKNVRLALAYAFDYEQYIELIGYKAPQADGPVPMAVFPGYEAPEIPYNTHDMEKAKEYMAQSDYPEGFEMTLYIDPGSVEKFTLAKLFQAQAGELGILVRVIIEPWVNIVARGNDMEAQHDADRCMNAFVLYTNPYYPDPSSVLLRMYVPNPPGVRNFLWYDNAEVNDLIDQGIKESDRGKAMDLYWQANLKIIEDVPDIFTNKQTNWNPSRTWVHGFKSYPVGAWIWSYYEIYKE